MKKIILALLATAATLLITVFILVPIVSNMGYSFVEGSYHLITHALLVALIFTVIFCTITIIEALNKDKEKSDADKKEL